MSYLQIRGEQSSTVGLSKPAETTVEEKKEEKPSVFIAAQDANGDGEITGTEIIDKGRISNFTYSDKIMSMIKDFKCAYDKTLETSMKAAEQKVEAFIADINKQITELGKKELKDEQDELKKQQGEDYIEANALVSYSDIDGNLVAEEYDSNGNLVSTDVQTPEKQKVAGELMELMDKEDLTPEEEAKLNELYKQLE